jgi:sugar phosphate isomerase/epimerase
MKQNWSNRVDEIKQLIDNNGVTRTAHILNTNTDALRKICKRYNIDIAQRKPYLKLASETKEEKSQIEREKRLTYIRNEWLTRRWA